MNLFVYYSIIILVIIIAIIIQGSNLNIKLHLKLKGKNVMYKIFKIAEQNGISIDRHEEIKIEKNFISAKEIKNTFYTFTLDNYSGCCPIIKFTTDELKEFVIELERLYEILISSCVNDEFTFYDLITTNKKENVNLKVKIDSSCRKIKFEVLDWFDYLYPDNILDFIVNLERELK
jgi:hypothetical protein